MGTTSNSKTSGGLAEVVGVLVVNVGTPDAPTTSAVRRYLREFLSDPRVLDMPAVLRWLLLNLVILPRRPSQSAAAYAKVWGEDGSPLLAHSHRLVDGLRRALGPGHAVAVGMRYGNPSLAAGLAELEAAGATRILVAPQFPQYSSAATGSSVAEIMRQLGGRWHVPPVEVLPPFFDAPGFLDAEAELIGARWRTGEFDHVLFSYHGLPERHVRRSDGAISCDRLGPCPAVGPENRSCYRAQCYATSAGLVARLGLSGAQSSTSFQSRLGRDPWIRPFTDQIIADLHARGVRKLLVACPSFTADCLETVEEVGMRLRADWLKLGGTRLDLVPCPNAEPSWVEALAGWIRSRSPVG